MDKLREFMEVEDYREEFIEELVGLAYEMVEELENLNTKELI